MNELSPAKIKRTTGKKRMTGKIPTTEKKLNLGFLGHFWPDFQNFCVLGTQNSEPDLIMTFAWRLVEVKVTRSPKRYKIIDTCLLFFF